MDYLTSCSALEEILTYVPSHYDIMSCMRANRRIYSVVTNNWKKMPKLWAHLRIYIDHDNEMFARIIRVAPHKFNISDGEIFVKLNEKRSTYPVRIRSSPIAFPTNNVAQFVATLRDVLPRLRIVELKITTKRSGVPDEIFASLRDYYFDPSAPVRLPIHDKQPSVLQCLPLESSYIEIAFLIQFRVIEEIKRTLQDWQSGAVNIRFLSIANETICTDLFWQEMEPTLDISEIKRELPDWICYSWKLTLDRKSDKRNLTVNYNGLAGLLHLQGSP